MKTFLSDLKLNPEFKHSVVGKFKGAKGENFENCHFDGINGDDLAKKYYPLHSLPSSCDVIKILEKQIDLIEFKTSKAFTKDAIKNEILKYELINKVKGSYDLLKLLITDNKITKVNKKFIVSIYLHSYATVNPFLIPSISSYINEEILEYFNSNPLPFRENFLEPKFVRTENINDLY